MSTMNVLLTKSLKDFVDEQVDRRGYRSSSEYVRELIRKEQDRHHLREMLLAGARSPASGEANRAYFRTLKTRLPKR